MHFSTALVLASIAAFASAQNPFTFTDLTSIAAGTPFNITWVPSTGTGGTISLVLRHGQSTDLDTLDTIASNVPNTGSYLWTPPSSIVNGAGYAFQIVDDGNPELVNYSNQFSIASSNNVSPVVSPTASVPSAPASSPPAPSASLSTTTTETAASTTVTASATTSGPSRSVSSVTATRSGTASGTQSPTSSPTSAGAASLKVGGGMLAALGAAMALL